MQGVHQLAWGAAPAGEKGGASGGGGLGGPGAMTEPVHDQEQGTIRFDPGGPVIPAHGLTRVRHAGDTYLEGFGSRRLLKDAGDRRRAAAGKGEHVKGRGHAPDGPEAGPGGARRREAVAQRAAEILDAGSPVHGDELHAEPPALLHRAHAHLAAPGVLDQVGGQLARDDRNAAGIGLVEAERPGEVQGAPPTFANLAALMDRQVAASVYFHFTTVTVVPSPGADRISKWSTRRRAPPRPSPSPVPVVNPSCSARGTSGMPAPRSWKTRRTPWRPPTSPTVSMISSPPPPCTTVLRAS